MFSNCMGRRFDLITLFGDGEGSVWSQRCRKGGSLKCGKAPEACGEGGLCSETRVRSEPGEPFASSVTLDKSLVLFTLQLSGLPGRGHHLQLQGR